MLNLKNPNNNLKVRSKLISKVCFLSKSKVKFKLKSIVVFKYKNPNIIIKNQILQKDFMHPIVL